MAATLLALRLAAAALLMHAGALLAIFSALCLMPGTRLPCLGGFALAAALYLAGVRVGMGPAARKGGAE